MNLESALIYLYFNTPVWVLPSPCESEYRSYRSYNGLSQEVNGAFQSIHPNQVIDLAAIYGYDCGKNPYYAPSDTLN